jgi:two-component system phosphate regulon sensor histidine kinase PhoR
VQGLIRSQFFWRLYASYCVVLVVTAVAIGLLVDRRLTGSQTEALERSLKRDCVLIGSFAERAFRGQEPEVVQSVQRLSGPSGLRITLILPDGAVLADSEEDPASMDNHGNRPEVEEARTEEFGMQRRFSRTVRYDMLYVARVLFAEEGELGVVRVAIPLRELQAHISAAHRSVVVGSGAGLVLALLLGMVLARRTTAPIAEITAVAQSMLSGDFGRRVSTSSKDEIGVLAETLNSLGVEITDRIARLSEEDAQLRAMFAGMVEGVIAVDEDDRVRFCNQAARHMLDLEREPFEGRRLWELVRVVGLETLLEDGRQSSAVTSCELTLGRESRERVVVAHASQFEGGGRAGLVVVLHDITDVRRLELIRRDFVANVSHELKTPLTSIKGFVETLLSGALHDEEKNERFLRRIDVNVERLNHLVSDLLSLARIESQGLDVVRQPIDWRDVSREVVKRHRDAIEKKGLAIKVDERSVVVLGDAEAMTQILDNLLDNAIQYTPAPGHIDLRFSQIDGFGVLEVRDTGPGIPPEDTERVFERFYRVDKARSRELGGTGLGLSIVKHLVGSLRGKITVESELGRGSRFVVELPMA